MANLFTKSEKYKEEYRCSIVKIGELLPIEGSDFLAKTTVDGEYVVVRKDQVKEGDVMFYATNETELDSNFLALNNLFELGEYEKNINAAEVSALIDEGKRDEAKRKVGYFNKYGRVKMIRLKGCPSFGFLFRQDEMALRFPAIKDLNLEDYVGTDFDSVNDVLFVKAYIPRIHSGENRHVSKGDKRAAKIAKFDRMIEGQFALHYDTDPLTKNIHLIKPTDSVVCSVKLHGTSIVIGNVLTKKPKWGGLYSKIFLYLPRFLQKTYEDYDVVYSSRTVVKNKFINRKVNGGFYGTDVWGEYYEMIKDYIPKGFTLYGEITGYVSGANSMLQKGYDYGSEVGSNKLMIYRINQVLEDGTKKEWDVHDVYDWTVELLNKLVADGKEEVAARIHPIDILYEGTLMDLYPDLSITDHWHENVLECLKNEKRFGMEELEPLCVNKVPREGFVLRINNDPIKEAWKLKCVKFMERESKEMDAGAVDVEMEDNYGQEIEA